MPTSFSGCSYLVLQPNHDVLGKPGYAPILLSIWSNKSSRSYDCLYIILVLQVADPWRDVKGKLDTHGNQPSSRELSPLGVPIMSGAPAEHTLTHQLRYPSSMQSPCSCRSWLTSACLVGDVKPIRKVTECEPFRITIDHRSIAMDGHIQNYLKPQASGSFIHTRKVYWLWPQSNWKQFKPCLRVPCGYGAFHRIPLFFPSKYSSKTVSR